MAAVEITPEDLEPFADIDPQKAAAMIEDAVALAARVAPCILDSTFEHAGAAKAILRGAILRWNDTGSGALSQVGAGPFQQSVDTRQPRRGMFWPSEIEQLQRLCAEGTGSAVFSVDTAAGTGSLHLPWCALHFGAAYCSCGVDIAEVPIYELGGGEVP